ncbi:MAG: hypothetical protein QM636_06860 [Rhizobium sp.]
MLMMSAAAILPDASRAGALAPVNDDFPAPLALRTTVLPGGSDTETLALMVVYGEGEDETKFIIEIRGPDDKPSGPISFSRGAFRHVPGSRPTQFFEHLAKALAANAPGAANAKLETLPFGMAFLRAATARLPGGGFGGGPGNWYATKLFLGEAEAEVYFNFNLVSGEAEFSMKDSDYGNTVLSELSKVIW